MNPMKNDSSCSVTEPHVFPDIILNPGERIDDLQRNGLYIIQDEDAFCFGMDAVLLSGFVRAPAGSAIVDLGTGNGIIPLLLSAKTGAGHITGFEIQDRAVSLASRSVEMNGLSDRISIVKGDIKEASAVLGRGCFDVVTSNPPYMKEGKGLKNPDAPKAIARHEILMDLEDLIREASRLLKEGGSFYMVHRPLRLPEIITTLKKHRLEPKIMRMIHPYITHEANMVLIGARKGGGPELRTLPPLIVYKEQGVYTEEIYDVYGY